MVNCTVISTVISVCVFIQHRAYSIEGELSRVQKSGHFIVGVEKMSPFHGPFLFPSVSLSLCVRLYQYV